MNAINSTLQADLEKLVRGETIPPESFRAILGDREAVRQLRRMLMVRALRQGEEPSFDLSELPQTDVDFTELADYLEHGRLKDSARKAAVESLLRECFPDLHDDVSEDTAVSSDAETRLATPEGELDTEITFPRQETEVDTARDDQNDSDTKASH